MLRIPATLILFLAPVAPALGSTLEFSTDCSTGLTEISLEVILDAPLDPTFASLVILRNGMSDCEPNQVVAEVPLAGLGPGVHPFAFQDATGDGAFYYYFETRDAQGAWSDWVLAFDPGTNPHVLDDDFAYCGSGPVAIGSLTQEAWWWNVAACPGDCVSMFPADTGVPWELTLGILPPETPFKLWGYFRPTIDGMFFAITSYEIATCTVSAEALSWGSLRARF